MLSWWLKLTAQVDESKRQWWALIAMIASVSMMMIDQTVLPLALPTIQRQFLLSNVMLQWTVNAYILGVAATVLLVGVLQMWSENGVFSA